jgi:GT2 family glycosyltransferase
VRVSLSIIIVNYKTPRLLYNCIESIYAQTNNESFEIIVVDNHSEDNSKDLITNAFTKVRWIQLDYNAGFARANNAGIRSAQGDILLLLNSDTINVSGAIQNCVHKFRSSGYIACGVQLLNADGTPQISGNYFITGGLNNLLPLPYIGNVLKWMGNFLHVKKPNVPDAKTDVEVDWINGAFLMIKTSVINVAGLMDEDFFLYAEEAEWCARLRKHGKLVIYGEYKVIHLQGESSNATFQSEGKGYYNLYDRKGFQIMLSNFVRIRKQLGIAWYIVHLLIYTFAVPVFLLGTLLKSIFTFHISSRDFSKLQGFTLNVGKLWSYSFIILMNKPFFYKVI